MLTFLANIIAIGNFLFSLGAHASISEGRRFVLPAGRELGLLAKFLIFLGLQAVLLYGWAYMLTLSVSANAAISPIALLASGLAAAWSALFNIQWLVIGQSATWPGDEPSIWRQLTHPAEASRYQTYVQGSFAYHTKFFFLALLSLILLIYYIWLLADDEDSMAGASLGGILGFVIMFVVFVI